jgi:hypothetical protein
MGDGRSGIHKRDWSLKDIMYGGVYSEVDTGPTCRVYQNAHNAYISPAFLIRSITHKLMPHLYCTINDALGTRPSSFNVCPKSI